MPSLWCVKQEGAQDPVTDIVQVGRVGDIDHHTCWEHKDWVGQLEGSKVGFIALISKEFAGKSSRDTVLA